MSSSSSASSAAAVVAMHWFRKGLRIHDNAALLAAVELAKQVCGFGREISKFILGIRLEESSHWPG